MNKYQKVLDKFINDGHRLTHRERNEFGAILQELVEQTKTFTLEQVKKEWDNHGFYWEEDNNTIHIAHKTALFQHVVINKERKTYNIVGNLTLQGHQLLTKTFKALKHEEFKLKEVKNPLIEGEPYKCHQR